MSEDPQSLVVAELYEALLRREPRAQEMVHWKSLLGKGKSFLDVLRALRASSEYRFKCGVRTAFPPGHYYSPVVDPETVVEYVGGQHRLRPEELSGIEIAPEEMLRFWTMHLPTIQATKFPEQATPSDRFHYKNGSFPYGDAIMLRAMIASHRPRRIIEIGSGYTTACMLDTADALGLNDLNVTCIEPYADRLRSLLRARDWARVNLIESPVQSTPLSIFSTLQGGDILFVDSTHVLKTGSDVHYEFFKILPVIASDVVIHFHDVPYPFEYPDEWVLVSNHSWNEAYFLQAFLMYNKSFKITMWNSLLALFYHAQLKEDFPLFLANPGSSIWLQKN